MGKRKKKGWQDSKPYSRSRMQVWQTFLSFAHVWHISVFLYRIPAPGCQRKIVNGRLHVYHFHIFIFQFPQSIFPISPISCPRVLENRGREESKRGRYLALLSVILLCLEREKGEEEERVSSISSKARKVERQGLPSSHTDYRQGMSHTAPGSPAEQTDTRERDRHRNRQRDRERERLIDERRNRVHGVVSTYRVLPSLLVHIILDLRHP